jgi:ABC-type antimicrobial peptide transport system permease subunit
VPEIEDRSGKRPIDRSYQQPLLTSAAVNGNNVLQVRPGQGFGRSGGGPQPPNFTVDDVTAVRDQIAGVTAIAPQAGSSATAVYEGSNCSTTVNGISCLVIGVLSTRGQAGFGGDQDDFNIFDTAQISATLTGTTTLLTSIVTAVAAISLVVGGIGIMNIMLVSVTERTREIGIRLAIGALAHEVLTQFLVEAIVLSCLGGAIGIVLAQLLVLVIAPLVQVPRLFVPRINVIAFLIAAAIGVVFGYFPARRAAGLNPIDALRYE